MDRISVEKRHNNMSHIRSTENSLERALRSELFSFGFRFRKNDRRLSGSPDIVFPHYHAVIFVNGCFWHAHGWAEAEATITSDFFEGPVKYGTRCSKFRLPSSNTEFWRKKFIRNRERDKKDIEKLLSEGWRVGIVWECSITGKERRKKIHHVASKISLWLEEEFGESFMEF